MTHVSKPTIEIKQMARILKHGDAVIHRFITSKPLLLQCSFNLLQVAK